jgi:hypothetical protein
LYKIYSKQTSATKEKQLARDFELDRVKEELAIAKAEKLEFKEKWEACQKKLYAFALIFWRYYCV